jgi:NADPH-dependent 2,4-dienoyl-CoA reductase/sulfur reductase-like enzyme
MTSDRTFVIVGASLAGAKAAETLREEGFDGRLVLIGAEHERPYERPPLSKDYLRGEVGREKVYVHEEAFYADHDIELRLGRTAVTLDPAAGEVGRSRGARAVGAQAEQGARRRGSDLRDQAFTAAPPRWAACPARRRPERRGAFARRPPCGRGSHRPAAPGLWGRGRGPCRERSRAPRYRSRGPGGPRAAEG